MSDSHNKELRRKIETYIAENELKEPLRVLANAFLNAIGGPTENDEDLSHEAEYEESEADVPTISILENVDSEVTTETITTYKPYDAEQSTVRLSHFILTFHEGNYHRVTLLNSNTGEDWTRGFTEEQYLFFHHAFQNMHVVERYGFVDAVISHDVLLSIFSQLYTNKNTNIPADKLRKLLSRFTDKKGNSPSPFAKVTLESKSNFRLGDGTIKVYKLDIR